MLLRAKREPYPRHDHRRIRDLRSRPHGQAGQSVALSERDAEGQDC